MRSPVIRWRIQPKEIKALAISQSLKATHITIDCERCKGCYFCISVCPLNIIQIASHLNQNGYTPAETVPEKAGQCTGCLSCASMCPDAAITIFRDS